VPGVSHSLPVFARFPVSRGGCAFLPVLRPLPEFDYSVHAGKLAIDERRSLLAEKAIFKRTRRRRIFEGARGPELLDTLCVQQITAATSVSLSRVSRTPPALRERGFVWLNGDFRCGSLTSASA
jgi:hypothetical protein